MDLQQPGTVNATYIGTKLIQAWPMSRAAYNDYRGWAMPENEVATDQGYLVEYLDGGKPNDERHKGYISWSPKEQFDGAYRLCSAMTFGLAIEALKRGARVARAGWNGKGMFVFLVPGSTFTVNRPPLLGIYPEGTTINYRPHIDIKGVDGAISTWVPSIGDVMAEDWMIAVDDARPPVDALADDSVDYDKP